MATRRLFDYRTVPRRTRALILACMLFWSVISYLFISHFVLHATAVVGPSMNPTLHDGDRCIMHRWIYRFRDPWHGEIVAIRLPGYNDLTVKRVVAIPHDIVRIDNGCVFVNQRKLNEPYLAGNAKTHAGPMSTNTVTVPDNRYFVLGDNREDSLDSRYFGTVHRKWIVGVIPNGHRSFLLLTRRRSKRLQTGSRREPT